MPSAKFKEGAVVKDDLWRTRYRVEYDDKTLNLSHTLY